MLYSPNTDDVKAFVNFKQTHFFFKRLATFIILCRDFQVLKKKINVLQKYTQSILRDFKLPPRCK